MNYGSLFAGVGGFDLGLDAAGWSCSWQVESDPSCQQILERHWPNVPRWGDICTVNGAELKPVDMIVFGSPCQDLSIAGKRAGLDGEKSRLFYEGVRVIKEMRDVSRQQFPSVVVWENVAGAVTSNAGADFGVVLDTFAELGALVIDWAVLDARWFGVPQRRRRVFVVSVFDPVVAERCTESILPVSPRVGWNPPPSRTVRSQTPAGFARSVGGEDRSN